MIEQRIYQVVYIRSSAAAVWDALTNPDITQRYWADTRIESDWKVGSTMRYLRKGALTDEQTILQIEKPRLLVHTFHPVFGEFQHEPASQVRFTLQEKAGVTRLIVLHDHFPPHSKVYRACSDGWPAILSSLKTLLETDTPLAAAEFEPDPLRWSETTQVKA
jgi:uncharacterized protein YndB with AHSA1/START domain